MKFCAVALLALFVFNSGCMARSDSQLTPAVLTSTNADVKLQLQKAATQLLFGHKVRLANDAFVLSHTLLIEKNASKDASGRLIEGRKLDGSAIELSLWKRGSHCYLQRKDTDTSLPLDGISCKAL